MYFNFLIFFSFFFLRRCETRGWNWGWESEAVGSTFTESRIAKELYLDLEAGRRASRNVVVRSTTLFVLCYSCHFFFFFFHFSRFTFPDCTLKKTTGQTLSPPRPSSPPTSMRRILSQPYSNRKATVSTCDYYLLLQVVATRNNADMQFRSFIHLSSTYFAENLTRKKNK